MFRKILLVILLLSLGHTALASGKDIALAMKAYQVKEYNRASNILVQAMADLPADKAEQAKLSLGIVSLKNAELNKAFYQASLTSNIEYLEALVKQKGKNKSKLAKLYLGETELNAGNYSKAIGNLNAVLKTKGISAKDKNLAKILLGQAYAKSGKKTKANTIWSQVKVHSPELATSLLVAKHRTGLKPKYDIKKLLTEINKLENANSGATSRHLSNMIYLTNQSGLLLEGFALMNSENLDAPAQRESFKGDKQISFYDTSLHANISELLLSLAKQQLASFQTTSKFAPTAAFYLMDAGVIFKDEKQIASAAASLNGGKNLPDKLQPFAPVKTSASQYISGHKEKAQKTWETIIAQNSSDTKMLAEVLRICSAMEATCNSALDRAKAISAQGQGRKFVDINTEIGRYLLTKGKSADALTYLELARDKSNKNKISANDPLLLVALAQAYRLENNYSENLEIYFEMNRFFPAVRQIQEAVQGTYAMHQKSAGDVKIF